MFFSRIVYTLVPLENLVFLTPSYSADDINYDNELAYCIAYNLFAMNDNVFDTMQRQKQVRYNYVLYNEIAAFDLDDNMHGIVFFYMLSPCI